MERKATARPATDNAIKRRHFGSMPVLSSSPDSSSEGLPNIAGQGMPFVSYQPRARNSATASSQPSRIPI